jgi:RimJ/RimL family protein N-acetyltransferase
MDAVNDAIAMRVDLRRLEEANLNCLPAPRQLFYDGWVLRVTPGPTRRARSVNAFFGSTLPLDEKIAHCEAVYERAGLPFLFRITPFDVPATLDAELHARGFVAFDNVLVQLVALDSPPAFDAAADVTVESVSASAFSEAMRGLKGTPARQRATRSAWLAQTPLPARAVVAKIDGRPVGVGQSSIDDGFAMIGSIATADGLRGRGIATTIVGALLAWAWDHNAHHAYLQVNDDNYRAHAVYRRFGFETVYEYHYRGRPE